MNATRSTIRGLTVGLAVAVSALLLAYPLHWRITPDSALYIGLAQSLSSGDGYRFNEAPHAHAFPGFPLLLAAIHSVADRTVDAFNLLSRLGLVAAVFVAVPLLRRRHAATGAGGVLPLTAAAVAMLTPKTFEWGTFILTEPVFLPLYLGFLLRLEREADGEGTNARGAVVTAALGISAFLIRPIALIAVAVWLGFRLRWAEPRRTPSTGIAGVTVVALIGFVGWWFTRAAALGPAGSGYEREIADRVRHLDVAAIWAHASQFLHHLSGVLLGVNLVPIGVGLALFTCAAIGVVRAARSGVRPLEVVTLATLVSLGGFPHLPDRYLMPLAAPLVYFSLIGLASVVERLPRAVLLGLLTGGTVAVVIAAARVLQTTQVFDSFTVRWLVLLAILAPMTIAAWTSALRGRSAARMSLAVGGVALVTSLAASDAALVLRHRLRFGTTEWATLSDAHWDPVLATIQPLMTEAPSGLVVTRHPRIVHVLTGWPAVRPEHATDPAEVLYVLAEGQCFDVEGGRLVHEWGAAHGHAVPTPSGRRDAALIATSRTSR